LNDSFRWRFPHQLLEATMRSRLNIAVAITFGFFIACAATGPLQAQDPDAFARLQTSLKQNDQITVTTDDGKKTKGRLLEVSPEHIVLSLKSGPLNIAAPRILKVQRKHNGVLLGAIIGAGAGIPLAIGFASYANNEGASSAWAAVPILVGAGIGTAIDAALPSNRTVYQRNTTGITLSPVVDRNRSGARVAWRF